MSGTRRRPPPLPDRLPEDTTYQDSGCGVWEACLTCPLMRCIEDDVDARLAFKRHRNRMLYRRYQEGRTHPGQTSSFWDLAQEFKLDVRTVKTIIARLKSERTGSD